MDFQVEASVSRPMSPAVGHVRNPGGAPVRAGTGHINLIEDTTGKGHMTRNFGPDDRIALTIPLADGVVIEGTRKPRTK